MRNRNHMVILLLLILAVILPIKSMADMIVYPQYTHIFCINAHLSISGGIASSSGSISPLGSSETRIVTVLVVLQRYEDGVWRTVKSWSATRYNSTASAGSTWSVTPGYQYRTYVSGRISDEEGVLLEHVTRTSQVVTYGAVE